MTSLMPIVMSKITMMIVITVIFSSMFQGANAAPRALPAPYNTLMQTGSGITFDFGDGTGIMAAALARVANEVAIWSVAAGSTSHEVRDSVLRLVANHPNANERPGILFMLILFTSLITNRSRLIRAIGTVQRANTQVFTSRNLSGHLPELSC